jgi:glycosyltransferase involved in cell wall biosynthesis
MAKEYKIPVLIVGKSRVDPFIPLRLAKHIRQGNYHLIDTQNIQSKLWGSVAALLSNIALVSTLNSLYLSEHGGNLKGRIYTALDFLTNWKTDHYVAVSETIKDALLMAGVSEAKVDVIHNAIEIDKRYNAEAKKRFRDDLEILIEQDSVLCVAVGRLVWAKGFDDMIIAFKSVVKKVHNAYLLIIGGGELFSILQSQIDEAGLHDRVFLLGYKDREWVLDALRSSDVFVMSSRSEGVPFALLEAAAMGLPIVATRCGGIPEVVSNNVEALLVPVGDFSALSEAIVKLCSNYEFAENLGKKAQSKIAKEYSLPVQLRAVERSYVQALEHRQQTKRKIFNK